MLARRSLVLGGSLTALVGQHRPLGVAQCAKSSSSTVPKDVVVFQYKICPFCNRVKAVLDYLRIPYKVVEVNPLTKGEIKFSKDYRKVPIVVFDGLQVNDSSPIIEHISDDVVKANSKMMKKHSGLFTQDTDKWGEWSEKRLAVYLYPNITRSMEESWECFEYTNNVKEWNPINRVGTRVAGTLAMTMANGKIKKKYNIVDERKELQLCLTEWVEAVGDKKYLHGEKITLPDLMVFGVLRSIEGLSTFVEIMQNNPRLHGWYERVARCCNSCEMKA
jgi:microsomal prostaglandin-E synthase 2